MSVVNSLNSRLFDESFQRMHGMTLDQAQQGYVLTNWSERKLHSPEEWEEIDREMNAKRPGYVPWRESIHNFMSQPVNVGNVIRDRWVKGGSRHLIVGHSQEVARDLIALGDTITNEGRVSPVPLYRGDNSSPQERAAYLPDMPLAFSENRNVARTHASWRREPRGQVFKVGAGSVKGISVNDYTDFHSYMQGTGTQEKEWLIDPRSVR